MSHLHKMSVYLEVCKSSSLDGAWLQAVPGAVDAAAAQACTCLGSMCLVEQEQCSGRISRFSPKKNLLENFSLCSPPLSEFRQTWWLWPRAGCDGPAPPDTDNPPAELPKHTTLLEDHITCRLLRAQHALGPWELLGFFFPTMIYQLQAARR